MRLEPAFSRLRAEHAAFRALLAAVRDAPALGIGARLADRLAHLEAHARYEDLELYPAVARAVRSVAGAVRHASEEHVDITAELPELLRALRSGSPYTGTLVEDLEHHFAEEEQNILAPALAAGMQTTPAGREPSFRPQLLVTPRRGSPRVLDVFAGAGGASLGAVLAGATLVRCVDHDRAACLTARAAGLPAVHVDVRDPAALAGVGDVDVLWGSPPCQAFSTAQTWGAKGADDVERNGWPWLVAAVDAVRPRWLVAENVRGAEAYVRDVVVPELARRFAHVELWTLDAAHYGLPQTRRRVFVVAGPQRVPPPPATHGPGTRTPLRSLDDALGLSLEVHRSQRGTSTRPSARPPVASQRAQWWSRTRGRSGATAPPAGRRGVGAVARTNAWTALWA